MARGRRKKRKPISASGAAGEHRGSGVVRRLGAWQGEAMERVRRAVQEGLPVETVAELQDELKELGVSRPSRYVESIVSRATRGRRETLTPEQGEKLVRVVRVLARALDVWEDNEMAAEFLTRPHDELEGSTPIARAQSEIGARQVEELLLKLDLGLPV